MTMQLFSQINYPLSHAGPHWDPGPIIHRGGYRSESRALAERVIRLLAADSPNSKRNKGRRQVIENNGYGVVQSERQGQAMTQRTSVEPLDEALLAGQLVRHEVVLELNYGGEHYAVVRTTSPLSPILSPQLSPQMPTGASPQLSPREEEIVWLVAQGCPDKVIADKLQISRWTVGTHLRRIFAKLAVNSRAEMVAIAVKQMGMGV